MQSASPPMGRHTLSAIARTVVACMWGDFRTDAKFTGKEEDIEVGLIYFGAPYYASPLGR